VLGVEPNEEKWDEMSGWEQAPCTAGTLVLIHGESDPYSVKGKADSIGSVMHRSPPNPSDKSRLIYTFHMIEGADGYTYDENNWYAQSLP
jgi:phytanoyl-CoA hydroxylase